ncbi:MAG: plasmid stabilization protein [Armatimonadetes bacterium]|nr:plasmid stabilization protein [Armatimonadota bacterium]
MATNIKPIYNESDYESALEQIDGLMDSEPDTDEFDRLVVLAQLVEAYEEKHFPIDLPDPVEAIKFRLDQMGKSNRDLKPILGSDSRVSEIMSGKRTLTLTMIRAVHEHLGVPYSALMHDPSQSGSNVPDASKYPVTELMKYGWLGRFKDKKSQAAEGLAWLFSEGQASECRLPLLREKSGSYRNAKTNVFALHAWCLHVRRLAIQASVENPYQQGSITLELLKQLAPLSALEDGPRLTEEFLSKKGVRLVFAKHLTKTYLDGAAFLLTDGSPVVALTLRHDRLDSFWHALMHELAHVGRHLSPNSLELLFDDFELGDDPNATEQEADEWAIESLVPSHRLNELGDLQLVSAVDIRRLAADLSIDAAIIAGRVQFLTRNYKKFGRIVGKRRVKSILGIEW